MCGRITLAATPKQLRDLFAIAETSAQAASVLKPRFNIPPSQAILAVRQNPDHGGRELVPLRWGLIPSWAKDPKIGNRLINARAESLTEKPSFRSALQHRRCLIPADGFFEWKKRSGQREPYCVRLRDGQPFALAGLWDQWLSPDGEVVESCTIVTTDANDLVRPLHDRMPVIVDPRDYDRWLDRRLHDPEQLQEILKPYPSAALTAYPVNSMVNDPRRDDPQCLEPRKPSETAPAAEEERLLF
jgi:putative SOS response-associated peptidase YedK